MTASRVYLSAATTALALAACSKPATPTQAPPLQSAGATAAATPPATSPYAATSASPPPGVAPDGAAAPPPPANGYSCTFPGPGGRSVLARFTLDGATAHDDQGMPFTVLTNSPSAVVLAHARDNLGAAPDGDVGAYVIAIDRRTLGMVESTVGLDGPDATRRGHCIAG